MFGPFPNPGSWMPPCCSFFPDWAPAQGSLFPGLGVGPGFSFSLVFESGGLGTAPGFLGGRRVFFSRFFSTNPAESIGYALCWPPPGGVFLSSFVVFLC